MSHIVQLKNIQKTHAGNNTFTLSIEHLMVKKGELVALVGASGSGKSTALDMVAGILQPDHGLHLGEESAFFFTPQEKTINMLAKSTDSDTLAKIRREYVGYILQTGGLLPFLTGKENILLSHFSHTKKTKEDSLQNLAKELDIEHLLHKKPAQMSVGERQRFAIARALYNEPKLILADEPVASLDPINAKAVLKLFVRLAQEKNISVLMVSHAPQMAQEMGFRLVTAHISREENHIISRIGGFA